MTSPLDVTVTTKERETLLSDIETWLEANPYKVYGAYDDQLSKEQVAELLESREKFDESWWEVEVNASDYADWSDHKKEIIEEFGDRILAAYPEFFDLGAVAFEVEELEFDDLPDEVQETFWSGTVVDCSDLLETCLRNSRCNIVALVDNPDTTEDPEDGIGPPNGTLDDELNEARVKYLADTFGIDGWAAESCYYHERLKVMGKLDLEDVYKNGKPVEVEISPDSQLIFHTSYSGSGCLGEVKATKTVTMPATFRCDDADRYGVQEVYGFVGEVWRNDIKVTKWEEWYS